MFFPQQFLNDEYNSTFKYQNFQCTSSFGELIIYYCKYAMTFASFWAFNGHFWTASQTYDACSYRTTCSFVSFKSYKIFLTQEV